MPQVGRPLEMAGLVQHKNVIYQKYRGDSHFREKVDRYRQKPGELVNEAFSYLIRTIGDKAKRGQALSTEEVQVLKFYAEKARAAQSWFVSRTETAIVKPITEEMLDTIEAEEEMNNDVASEIKKQMVAIEQPVQNQEQTGEISQIPAQSDAGQVSA